MLPQLPPYNESFIVLGKSVPVTVNFVLVPAVADVGLTLLTVGSTVAAETLTVKGEPLIASPFSSFAT